MGGREEELWTSTHSMQTWICTSEKESSIRRSTFYKFDICCAIYLLGLDGHLSQKHASAKVNYMTNYHTAEESYQSHIWENNDFQVLVTINYRQQTTVVYILLRKKYRMFNTYITNLMKHCENTGSQMMQNHLYNMRKHLGLSTGIHHMLPSPLCKWPNYNNSSHIHISIFWSTLF